MSFFLSLRLFAPIVIPSPKDSMHRFINTRHLSANELESFLACCDARAKKEGYVSWSDVHLESPLKRTIILDCIKSCDFPVTVLEDVE